MLKQFRVLTSHENFKLFLQMADHVTQRNYMSLTLFNTKSLANSLTALTNNNPVVYNLNLKQFHTDFTCLKKSEKPEDKELMEFPDFRDSEKKDRVTFLEMIKKYEKAYTNRAGHVDFIRTALKHMKEFGVHKDLEAYKKLLDVLPKGVFICKNKFLADSMYFPRQQFVALDLLEQIEMNGVLPDVELGHILINTFGRTSHPCKKFYRMMYWTTKFKNRSPWLLPEKLPNDSFLLAKLAIERITSPDIQTEITVFQTTDVPESIDKTWIVSGQSPKQKELLLKHSPKEPVIVEGGDIVWVRDKTVSYFILKADCEPYPFIPPKDKSDISKIKSPYFNPDCSALEEVVERSVHEQDDGLIYAVCATGTSSKDSLLSWVRLLQKLGNPSLENVPVLFRFKEKEKTIVPFSDAIVEQKKTAST